MCDRMLAKIKLPHKTTFQFLDGHMLHGNFSLGSKFIPSLCQKMIIHYLIYECKLINSIIIVWNLISTLNVYLLD